MWRLAICQWSNISLPNTTVKTLNIDLILSTIFTVVACSNKFALILKPIRIQQENRSVEWYWYSQKYSAYPHFSTWLVVCTSIKVFHNRLHAKYPLEFELTTLRFKQYPFLWNSQISIYQAAHVLTAAVTYIHSSLL